jgi:Mn-dependent DtxR family transcriptional regulator
MPVKDIMEGRIYIPESDNERKTLEGLVEKGAVEYKNGGYWLTKQGIKICKKAGWKE